MNQESLQTSFWIMVLIQTIGSVDMPGKGERKMPSPRQYVAIFITWLVLQFVSGINASAERAAAALGWLLVLAGLVIGPFGQQVTKLFTTVAKGWSISATESSPVTAVQPTTGSSQ